MITFDEKKYPQITDAEIKDALQFSTEQVIRDLPEFTEKVPESIQRERFLSADSEQLLDLWVLDRRDLAGL